MLIFDLSLKKKPIWRNLSDGLFAAVEASGALWYNAFMKLHGGACMTINEYQRLALTTANPNLSEKDMLLNGVMGLCGEAGEVIDLVKKHLAQGHALDKEHLAKELGDVAWYLALTASAIGYSLEDVFQMNIDKLKKRYPEGFAAQKSIARSEKDI